MKEILKAVQAELRNRIGYVRSGDIFITADEDYMPNDVSFPCIGIKDGQTEKDFGMGGCADMKIQVLVMPVVNLLKREAALVGDGVKKGLLDICSDITEILQDNLLGIDGMILADAALSQSPAQMVFNANYNMYFRKILKIQYEKRQ